MSTFLENLGADVRSMAKRVQKAAYLPWALTLEMAGFPQLQTVMFEDEGCMSLVRNVFGGAVVAIEYEVGKGRKQRVYLPVLDTAGAPISVDAADGRDLTDTINRCRARTVAMTHGVGLTLWSDLEGDGPEYVKALGVQTDTDLRAVAELRDVKEIRDRNGTIKRTQSYLGWHAALAAAKITDPEFYWEVVECQTVDENGVQGTYPFAKVRGKGWVVGVRVVWKNIEHVEWLPIMGVEQVSTRNGPKAMEHQSINEVNAFQWHSACMRCLAKAIAMCTGYGYRAYAGDLGVRLSEEQTVEEKQQPAARQPKPQPKPQPQPKPKPEPQVVAAPEAAEVATGSAETHQELLDQVKGLMPFVNDRTQFHAWLGVPSLEEASIDDLDRARSALLARKERIEPIQGLIPEKAGAMSASVH